MITPPLDEEEEEFDPDNVDSKQIVKDLNGNPLLDRVQQALFSQLTSEKQTVLLEVKDREEELKR